MHSLTLSAVILTIALNSISHAEWPNWRGPNMDGSSSAKGS